MAPPCHGRGYGCEPHHSRQFPHSVSNSDSAACARWCHPQFYVESTDDYHPKRGFLPLSGECQGDSFLGILGAGFGRELAVGYGRGETKRGPRLKLVWGERLISPARFRAYCLIMESIGIGCRNVDTVSKQRSLPDPEICRTTYRGGISRSLVLPGGKPRLLPACDTVRQFRRFSCCPLPTGIYVSS